MSGIAPPTNENELLILAKNIAGMTLAELAHSVQLELPTDLHHAKGWQGQLFEKALGATAGNKSMPDFSHLGIELKSIPVGSNGLPRETTYICTASHMSEGIEHWRTSRVYQKLARVLWIPIEAEPSIAIADRCIGMPLLWSPDPDQENCLQKDWEELTELLTLGQLDNLTAHQGVALQIRPKAANATIQTAAIDEEGQVIRTSPRGFYLRTTFTQEILRASYVFTA